MVGTWPQNVPPLPGGRPLFHAPLFSESGAAEILGISVEYDVLTISMNLASKLDEINIPSWPGLCMRRFRHRESWYSELQGSRRSQSEETTQTRSQGLAPQERPWERGWKQLCLSGELKVPLPTPTPFLTILLRLRGTPGCKCLPFHIQPGPVFLRL